MRIVKDFPQKDFYVAFCLSEGILTKIYDIKL